MFLSSADGDLGNFLSCLKGVKENFRAQVGRWDFSHDAEAEEGLSSLREENLLGFFELQWASSGIMAGTSQNRSWGLREAQSPRES